MGKLLIWCTLTRSLADRWGWARGFLRDCEGKQNCGNQTISGWKLGSHVGWWPWEWVRAYSPLGWLTGRKQTPGLYKVFTHSHSSLRRLRSKKSANKQVNVPAAQKEPGFSVVSLSYCYHIDFTMERDLKLHTCVTLLNWKNAWKIPELWVASLHTESSMSQYC